MQTELSWQDIPAIHRAGALSKSLQISWGRIRSIKDGAKSPYDVLRIAQSRARGKEGRYIALSIVAVLATVVFVTVILMPMSAPLSWALVGTTIIVGVVAIPGDVIGQDAYEMTLVKQFAKDLSRLCNDLQKTPTRIAILGEIEIYNLATAFLKSAAGEVAKFDPTSTWSDQRDAHEKLREDFKKAFDFYKSFGLVDEKGGWEAYFPKQSIGGSGAN